MPVFNRVRIINIRYDNREITDEMFDYYDGCNALMNLANGSGKTVMVEALFQPILPNMSVGKWKITDYLTGDQRPTFVMIEWLLDNTKDKTYFTTGICMSITLIEHEDAQPIKSLKYFTFTHTYTQGNAFDIENIPLLLKKGENAKYQTYDEVLTLLKKYTRNHPEFSVFRKHEQKDYQVHLRQHNIFPEEWSLLETINQGENGGGMGKLFESCTTSDLLFDRWILKKISDTNREQRSTLMYALTELTRPMIESDQKLREKEQAEDVAEQLHQFEQVFQSYTDTLDRKEQQERRLAGILLHTELCCEQREKEMEQAQNEQEQCRNQEEHIHLEQLSERHHTLLAELQAAGKSVELLEALLPEYEEKEKNSVKLYRLMQAAEYKSAQIRAMQELETARNQQRTLEQGDAAERLQNLGYTLYLGYTHAAEYASEVYQQCQKQLDAFSRKQIECKKNRKDLSEKNNILIASKAKAEQRLEQLEAQFSGYQAQIGRLPETNIIGELVADSVQEIHEALQLELKKSRDSAADIAQQMQQTLQEIEHNQDVQRKLDTQIDENQAILTRHRTQMESYKQQIEQIISVLAEYEIADRYLYEKEENLIRMKERYSNIHAALDRARQQLAQTEDKLEKLQNDCLHTASQFTRLLQQNDIAFQTGESYLKQQSREFQQQLLAQNPLLPYCYLVSDVDYDKVLAIPEDAFADRLCPVLRKKEIGFAMESSSHVAAFGAIRFYSLYDRESMDPETRADYEQKLSQRRETLLLEIGEDSNTIKHIQKDIHKVEEFSLTRQAVEALQRALQETETQRTDFLQERKKLRTQAETLSSKHDSLRDASDRAKQSVKQAEQRLSAFAEYIKLFEEASQERQKTDRLLREMDHVQKDISICEDRLDELNETCQELHMQQSNAERDRNDAQEKLSYYAQYTDGELLTGELEQMTMEYQSLYQKQDKNRKELDEICKRSQATISYNQNQLTSRFCDLEEDEIPMRFDATKLAELEKQEKHTKEALWQHQRNTEQAKDKAEQLREELQKTDRELEQAGMHEPLPMQQIKGNYDQRRTENNSKRKAAEQQERNARYALKELSFRRAELEKLVDQRILQDTGLTPVTEEVDLPAECLDFNAKKSIAQKQFKRMKSVYADLLEQYSNADHWITDVLSFIQFEDCETYVSCYYLYEQLRAKEKMLQDEIQILQTELSNLENNRMHIIRQIYEHATFLVKQVKDISANSYVTLQGKRQKMLEIVFPEVSDSQAEQRIANLTDEVTLRLRQQFTEHPEEENKLYDAICSYYSDRTIFNVYTNLQTIQINVLKILQDERNSRLEEWEARYSGGERFITYFIAYSALADYTRRQVTANQKGYIRSVFLVDNPFGEASSEHLVKSLIEITKKFRTQLICLSDLKQSSITNHFDLIYQLSMRRALYSSKSHLHTDKCINHAEASRNSHLEFVSLRSQFTFFDE